MTSLNANIKRLSHFAAHYLTVATSPLSIGRMRRTPGVGYELDHDPRKSF